MNKNKLINRIIREEISSVVNKKTDSPLNAFTDNEYMDIEYGPDGKMIVGIS